MTQDSIAHVELDTLEIKRLREKRVQYIKTLIRFSSLMTHVGNNIVGFFFAEARRLCTISSGAN